MSTPTGQPDDRKTPSDSEERLEEMLEVLVSPLGDRGISESFRFKKPIVDTPENQKDLEELRQKVRKTAIQKLSE
jgi:hypothetical protein